VAQRPLHPGRVLGGRVPLRPLPDPPQLPGQLRHQRHRPDPAVLRPNKKIDTKLSSVLFNLLGHPRASRPRWPPATCCATSPWRCRRASGWPGPCNCPSWPRPTSRTWSRCTWSGARRCGSTSCARPR
jgi:hypothetical protein